jgi:hypothetical protein
MWGWAWGDVLIGRSLPHSPLTQVSAVHIESQVETEERLVVETWLRRKGVITITQDNKRYRFSRIICS